MHSYWKTMVYKNGCLKYLSSTPSTTLYSYHCMKPNNITYLLLTRSDSAFMNWWPRYPEPTPHNLSRIDKTTNPVNICGWHHQWGTEWTGSLSTIPGFKKTWHAVRSRPSSIFVAISPMCRYRYFVQCLDCPVLSSPVCCWCPVFATLQLLCIIPTPIAEIVFCNDWLYWPFTLFVCCGFMYLAGQPIQGRPAPSWVLGIYVVTCQKLWELLLTAVSS